jgi:tRNA (guanine-N7-)-methyltransferase
MREEAFSHSMPEGQREYLQRRAARIDSLRTVLSGAFSGSDGLTLEIGCGHGHFLTAYAMAHPQQPCLGVDLVTKRIAKANQKAVKRGLNHLHFVKADITECLIGLPANVMLQRIFILFPDPWPKKRHRKNRIVQQVLLDELAKRSSSSTTLHFRSDHAVAFDWAMDCVAAHPRWHVDDTQPWPFESPSFFQDLMDSYSSFTAVAAPGGEARSAVAVDDDA